MGLGCSKTSSGPSSSSGGEACESTGLRSAGELESDGKCKICFTRRQDTVLIPCGHIALCKLCAAQCEECPICRKTIVSRHQAYFC